MTLNHIVNKPANFIFNSLSDTNKFVAAHPVIYEMKHSGNNQYQVFERFKFWLIRYSFNYTAIIEIYYSSKKIKMTANVFNRIAIEMTFNIKQVNDHSIVKEDITFKNAWPFQNMLKKIFRKQHNLLFKNIEKTIY